MRYRIRTMRTRVVLLPICLSFLLSGCGSSTGKTVIPDRPLTEEQKAAIQADDQRVGEEEQQTPLKFNN